jgi:lipopolysaccharide/colanic/teichoic acid biosynthesis glycosyltransferase
MRADRSGTTLAILLIELTVDRATGRDFAWLGRVLAKRLRLTDVAGIYSDRCVAVLLPDTPQAGAWKVASDVCAVYPVGHDRPNCEVYVYPDDRLRPVGTESDRIESPTARSGATTNEALFARPISWPKRLFDVIAATAGLALSAPLVLLIAVLIKLSSRGPVFYTQQREGFGGRRFQMLKFRTMRPDAERQQATLRLYSEQDGPAFKMSRDPRTTWIGRWLRRLSLDELPQLWNVLRGEMSLVGPRPLPTQESLQCEPWQRLRLAVTPGLTCIWQVRGRNTVPFDDWMRMDLQYVRQSSFAYDLYLLLQTVPAIVLQRGPR